MATKARRARRRFVFFFGLLSLGGEKAFASQKKKETKQAATKARREGRGFVFFFVRFVSSWRKKAFAEQKEKKAGGHEGAKVRKGACVFLRALRVFVAEKSFCGAKGNETLTARNAILSARFTVNKQILNIFIL